MKRVLQHLAQLLRCLILPSDAWGRLWAWEVFHRSVGLILAVRIGPCSSAILMLFRSGPFALRGWGGGVILVASASS